MRKIWLLGLVVLAGAMSGCGPSTRDVQLEKAAKANWTKSLLVPGQENTQALSAWRSLCRACAPESACVEEEQSIRADPKQSVLRGGSLCEAQQYAQYRTKPSFLR